VGSLVVLENRPVTVVGTSSMAISRAIQQRIFKKSRIVTLHFKVGVSKFSHYDSVLNLAHIVQNIFYSVLDTL
jgi:hypothetical protein